MLFHFHIRAAVVALTACIWGATGASAATTAEKLAQLVVERPANEGRAGTMHFRLQNRSGSVRERQALMIHSARDDADRIAIFFTEPAMIEETAFLSFNHTSRDDESWLFLPATERVRRLPTSDRGDNFMGTDLTYGDIKDDFTFGLEDWVFAIGGDEMINGVVLPILEGKARTPDLGREMGYSSFRALIDRNTGFPMWIEYSDTDGSPMKRMEILKVEKVGDAQTAMHFKVDNLQTGHSTEIHFTDMKYVPDLDESLFDPDALAYGIPDVI